MGKITKLIRFDWAIKRLLRHKANFGILEGFLSVLLKEDITIRQILDSESNKEKANDKYNRVDILVEDSKGELIIIEVQNSKEYDYFHRILFGTSKVITEHISEGEPYSIVKKVISITIAYFDLGQGEDYVYHGINIFKGIHKGDILSLADRQKELYRRDEVHQIFPEYWLLKVGQFDDTIQDKLDEWIYFLKNGKVQDDFTAKGLNEAKERLNEMKLSEDDRKAYNSYLKRLRDIASEEYNKRIEVQELIEEREKISIEKGEKIGIEKGEKIGIEKGIEEQLNKNIIGLYKMGLPKEKIAEGLETTLEKVEKAIKEYLAQ